MSKNLNILGINGWVERGHDASACLLRGNKIVAMVEEERFIRKRYAFDSLPTSAVAFCLEQGGITVDEVDYIAFGWDLPYQYKLRGIPWKYKKKEVLEMIFPNSVFKYKKMPRLVFIPHHLSHAASAYMISGFNEASILVLDGQGEDSSGLMAHGRDGKIKVIKKFPIISSLGYLYESVASLIGFRTSDAGKVMGLAAYGKPKYPFANIKPTQDGYLIKNFPDEITLNKNTIDEQEAVIKLWQNHIEKNYGTRNEQKSRFDYLRGRFHSNIEISKFHKNLAASVQAKLEEIIIGLVKILVNKTGCRNLAIAGGVGLNCSVNGKLIESGVVENVFIQPAANDGGVSLGAALMVSSQLGSDLTETMSDVYFGPEFDNNQIKSTLKELKIKHKYTPAISNVVAKLLEEGKIIGWFQGKMEVGPRALGNRSILADPRSAKIRHSINTIKSREEWRPLAPSILEENREEFFDKGTYSPFMLQAHTVKSNKREVIPAVVHKDNTVRYQSVTEKTNKKFYRLIRRFKRLTGIPLVLNTSFNTGGEPIVCTPYDAIKTFFNSPLDYLALGDFLVSK